MEINERLCNLAGAIGKLKLKAMDISIVVPLYNEDESISELHAWIARVMKENALSYEVIFVSDGSTDRSWDVISEPATHLPEVMCF